MHIPGPCVWSIRKLAIGKIDRLGGSRFDDGAPAVLVALFVEMSVFPGHHPPAYISSIALLAPFEFGRAVFLPCRSDKMSLPIIYDALFNFRRWSFRSPLLLHLEG